jgi:hypothetical protein
MTKHHSEVITAVKKLKLVFWLGTPYGLVGRHQHFRGTYFPIFHSEDGRSMFLQSTGYLPTSPHGITMKKNQHLCYGIVVKTLAVLKHLTR